MADWLWLPHTALLTMKKDRAESDLSYSSGAMPDPLAEPAEIPVFIEAKDALWTVNQGIESERQGFLVIGYPSDLAHCVTGDVLEWNGRKLKVENRPKVYDFGDGYPSCELAATDLATGGRK